MFDSLIASLFVLMMNGTDPAQPFNNKLSVTKNELECLALNIYHEARDQNLQGRLSVALVALNRAHSKESRWPSNVCDVIKQGSYRSGIVSRNMCQFSWYCDGKSDRPRDWKTWNRSQREAYWAYIMHYYGFDITNGATNYYSTKYISNEPPWTKDRGMKFVGDFDEHRFYRWE